MSADRPAVLLTRARGENRELAKRIETFGARAVEFPTIEICEPEDIRLLERALDTLDQYDWIVFTSTHGVGAVAARLNDREVPRVAAVGSATARRAAECGFRIDLTPAPARFRAEGLLEAFPTDLSGIRILLPQGDLADPSLARGLRARGARVNTVVAYRTTIPEGDPAELMRVLGDPALACITFTSGSTVGNLWSMLDTPQAQAALSRVAIAAIGPVTARAVRERGLEVAVQPEEATIPALAEAIAEFLRVTGGTDT